MDRVGLGPARALFLRLAGATAGPTGAAASSSAGRLALAGADWADVRALARREEVAAALWPRLRHALEGQPAAALPLDVAEAFRGEAMVAEFNARRLEARLQEVLGALAARGIEPVLLKGAGLAYTVFGGMARRPMRDLDLLVPREALTPAIAALRAAGWAEAEGGRPADRYAAHQHAPPLIAPAGGVGVVELHDGLFPPGHPFRLDGATVLGRARRVPSPLGAVLVPAPVDQLLHACLHFAWSHELRWGAWRAVADVAALVAAAAAEDAAPAAAGSRPTTRALDEIVEAARSSGGASAVYWTLRLSAVLGEVPVPEEWLTGLASGGWGESALVERHLAHQLLPGPGNVPSVALGRRGWEAALRPGRSGHGAARPWLVGAAGEAAGGRASVADRPGAGTGTEGRPGGGGAAGWAGRLGVVGRRLSDRGRWVGYVRALLGRAGGSGVG